MVDRQAVFAVSILTFSAVSIILRMIFMVSLSCLIHFFFEVILIQILETLAANAIPKCLVSFMPGIQ